MTTDMQQPSWASDTTDDVPAPSWIRLLDPPRDHDRDPGPTSRKTAQVKNQHVNHHHHHAEKQEDNVNNNRTQDVAEQTGGNSSSREELERRGEDREGGEGDNDRSNLWYMSPFLNKPVIGYYNRLTQSNLSLASPPLGGSFSPDNTFCSFGGGNAGGGGGGGGGYGGGGGGDGGGWWKGGDSTSPYQRRSSLQAFPQDQSVYSELGAPWIPSSPVGGRGGGIFQDRGRVGGGGGPAYSQQSEFQPSSLGLRHGQSRGQGQDNPGFFSGYGYASVDRKSSPSQQGRELSASSPPLPPPPLPPVYDRPPTPPMVLKPEEYLSDVKTGGEGEGEEEGGEAHYSRRSSRDEGMNGGPCGPCSRLVTLALALMGLTIVGLATALTVSVLTQSGPTGSSGTQAGYPVVRAEMMLKILNKNFSQDMADPDSSTFSNVSVPYSTELDRLFLTSPLAKVYLGNKVTALGPGSISVRTELLFLDTGLVTKEETVQNVIKSAERASSQWDESDARSMGQFVVCSDCVTVNLNFTRLPQLPAQPVLLLSGSEESAPVNTTTTTTTTTTTESPVTDAGGGTTENSTVSTAPNIVVSNSTPFLSDGNVVITCDVTNAGGWLLLTLEFKSDNSSTKTRTVLVTVQSGSPSRTQTSESRISAFPVASSDYVSLVVNVSDVTCADRGDYRCGVKMSNGKEFSATGYVKILELPSVPQIQQAWTSKAWDATLIYRCNARLGYPPGALSFSVARDEHSPWEQLAMVDVTGAKGCHGNSSVAVSAIHPAIVASSGETGSRLRCQVLSEHLQHIDPGEFSDVLHLHPSSKLEIQTKSTSVGQGLAAIRCRLHLLPPQHQQQPQPQPATSTSSWSRLTLLKTTSNKRGGAGEGEKKEVTSLRNDGSVTWTDNYLRHRTLIKANVSEGSAELNVFIFSLKCSDEGVYSCSLHPPSLHSPSAPLNVTAKPSKPALSVPSDVFKRTQYPITVTCKAKVGRPAGRLVLAIKHPNEADFRELNFNEQTSIPLSCTTEARGTFYANAGDLHDGSIVSCSVLPHPALGVVEGEGAKEEYDNVQVFNVLSDMLCHGHPETNISHPKDCGHVISCRNNAIVSVHRCPDGFCFNNVSNSCRVSRLAHSRAEPAEGPCYPDKDQVTMPHPAQCTAFLQCHRGHQATQHCPTAQLYVTGRQCSADVTVTSCYKQLDRESGVVTNATTVTAADAGDANSSGSGSTSDPLHIDPV